MYIINSLSILICEQFHNAKYSFAFFLISIEIEMITLSNKKLTVTYHNYQRSWNEAAAICDNNGGRLYVEDSAERTVVIEKYNADFWAL
jgi:hypothetical protein